MWKVIRYILSLCISIAVLTGVGRYLGFTWGDVEYLITNGMEGLLKILELFRESLQNSAF